jgi:AcrR family transcriptional regulator
VVGVKGQTQQRGVERRAAIVDAALALFAEGGYRSGALTTLADRVGVTGPAILHHFGSKDNLLAAVIEEADRRWTPMVREVFDVGGLETLRRLRWFADAMESGPHLPALHLRLEVETATDGGTTTSDYFLGRARTFRSLLTKALLVGQESGEIDPALDAREIAEEAHAFIDGAARAWLVDRELSVARLVDRYLTALEERIRTRPRGRSRTREAR